MSQTMIHLIRVPRGQCARSDHHHYQTLPILMLTGGLINYTFHSDHKRKREVLIPTTDSSRISLLRLPSPNKVIGDIDQYE